MLSTERRQTETSPSQSLPIWMAALLASGAERSICWEWRSGRAVYTNGSAETETVEPFGVPVQRGETIAVTWLPGDTAYTIELHQPDSLAA
jgi:hypothetical protein